MQKPVHLILTGIENEKGKKVILSFIINLQNISLDTSVFLFCITTLHFYPRCTTNQYCNWVKPSTGQESKSE